jgi:hypothetical protein
MTLSKNGDNQTSNSFSDAHLELLAIEKVEDGKFELKLEAVYTLRQSDLGYHHIWCLLLAFNYKKQYGFCQKKILEVGMAEASRGNR